MRVDVARGNALANRGKGPLVPVFTRGVQVPVGGPTRTIRLPYLSVRKATKNMLKYSTRYSDRSRRAGSRVRPDSFEGLAELDSEADVLEIPDLRVSMNTRRSRSGTLEI